jgi:hypothetical protein
MATILEQMKSNMKQFQSDQSHPLKALGSVFQFLQKEDISKAMVATARE